MLLSKHYRAIATIALTLFLSITMTIPNIPAQGSQKTLSAAESDPVKMGWMQGFPPPKDKILKAVDQIV